MRPYLVFLAMSASVIFGGASARLLATPPLEPSFLNGVGMTACVLAMVVFAVAASVVKDVD